MDWPTWEKCGKMHDRIECMRTEQLVQQAGIPQIALNQFTTGYQFPVSGGQVVQNDHLKAALE